MYIQIILVYRFYHNYIDILNSDNDHLLFNKMYIQFDIINSSFIFSNTFLRNDMIQIHILVISAKHKRKNTLQLLYIKRIIIIQKE